MYDSFRLLYTCLYTFLYICPSVFFVCLSCCIPVLTSSQQPPFLPMLTYRILPCCFNSFNFCRIFPWEYPVYSAISAVVSRFWLKKSCSIFEYSPAFFSFWHGYDGKVSSGTLLSGSRHTGGYRDKRLFQTACFVPPPDGRLPDLLLNTDTDG